MAGQLLSRCTRTDRYLSGRALKLHRNSFKSWHSLRVHELLGQLLVSTEVTISGTD